MPPESAIIKNVGRLGLPAGPVGPVGPVEPAGPVGPANSVLVAVAIFNGDVKVVADTASVA